MKKRRVEAMLYTLEEEDIRGLPEFDGRSVDELRPSILIVKSGLPRQKTMRVYAEICDYYSCAEITYRLSYTKEFEEFETKDGFLKYVLALCKIGTFHWQELLEEYDKNNISFERKFEV